MPTYSPATTVTITLASLANNRRATSSAIDNSSTRYDSAKFQLKLTTGATVDTSSSIAVNLVGSHDGTTYADHFDDNNLLVRVTGLVANTAYIWDFDLPAGMTLPPYFKIAVTNGSGATLNPTGGNHSLTFIGVKEAFYAVAAAANYVTATHAAATITYAAAVGQRHSVEGVAFSYSGTTPVGNLTVTDGGVTVFSMDVTGDNTLFVPLKLMSAVNSALVFTLSDGGSGVVGKVNVVGKSLI
jgi:hypothetical protein